MMVKSLLHVSLYQCPFHCSLPAAGAAAVLLLVTLSVQSGPVASSSSVFSSFLDAERHGRLLLSWSVQ